jgi:hypothetical protein
MMAHSRSDAPKRSLLGEIRSMSDNRMFTTITLVTRVICPFVMRSAFLGNAKSAWSSDMADDQHRERQTSTSVFAFKRATADWPLVKASYEAWGPLWRELGPTLTHQVARDNYIRIFNQSRSKYARMGKGTRGSS